MTPKKPGYQKHMRFWAILVRTKRETKVRLYMQYNYGQAKLAAGNKADCLEVLQVEEISEAKYRELKAKLEPEEQCRKHGVAAVRRHTSSRESRGLAPR